MPAERYYINESLELGQSKELREAEFHHLAHVMRVKAGEQIEIVNGKGRLAQAIIEKVAKDKALLQIVAVEGTDLGKAPVILAQGLPKPNRLDFILEKGTELGVSEFWLFPGDTSVKKGVFPNQVERMNSQLVAAMKQCGRLFLPEIKIMPPLCEWETWEGSAFFGDVDPAAPLFEKLWNDTTIRFPVLFFVGPESGFSEKEASELKARGARGVKLHGNILRTDTAAIAALSLIEHWLLL